jgi:hypothetical protein
MNSAQVGRYLSYAMAIENKRACKQTCQQSGTRGAVNSIPREIYPTVGYSPRPRKSNRYTASSSLTSLLAAVSSLPIMAPDSVSADRSGAG